MKNTVIWGLEGVISRQALLQLEQDNEIMIKAWFGEKNKSPVVTHDCFELQRGSFAKSQYYKCEESIYWAIYQNIYQCFDIYSRNFANKFFSLNEYLHLVNLVINFFYELLKKENIELVIFANIPHEGPDYILYLLSKAMDIPTILMTQSLFPDRFFYVKDIEDFGLFSNVHEYQQLENKVEIEQKFEKELFYMKEIACAKTALTEDNGAKLKKSRWRILLESKKKYLNLLDRVLSHLSDSVIKYRLEQNYQKREQIYFKQTFDEGKKFVYFPLHLQPEMTTSALGGVYCDQLLALEHLSAWLPEDWKIYVKENPKQTSFMREKNFFARLIQIPKVQLLDRHTNTYQLIKQCQFVATITGTAGWEAISGGKNAVVFGKAWYQTLPGCFHFNENLSIDNVLNYKIQHAELEEKFTLLLNKTATGIVDKDYIQIVDDFDIQNNNKKLLEFFHFMLQEIQCIQKG